MTSILLVDDHFLVRDGIKAILEDQQSYQVIGEGTNGLEAIQLVEELQPDIMIIDIRMPEMSGIDAVKQLRDRKNSTKVVMLSMHDSDEYILQSISSGADGYLLKDASKEEFLRALSVVSGGEKYFSGDVSTTLVNNILSSGSAPLVKEVAEPKETKPQTSKDSFDLTKRENQILQLAVSGMTNKDIAEELNISKRTIEVHRFNLMKKMGVKNILELSNKAKEFGMIS